MSDTENSTRLRVRLVIGVLLLAILGAASYSSYQRAKVSILTPAPNSVSLSSSSSAAPVASSARPSVQGCSLPYDLLSKSREAPSYLSPDQKGVEEKSLKIHPAYLKALEKHPMCDPQKKCSDRGSCAEPEAACCKCVCRDGWSGYSCLVPPDFGKHLAKAVGPLVGEQEVLLVLSNDRPWFWNYLHWLRYQPKMLARLFLVCSDKAAQKSIPRKARELGLELDCPVVGVEKFWTNDAWGGFTQLKQVILMEVLKYGFGTLQMDTDMGIIRNPLPYIQGDADFEFTSDAWDLNGVRGGAKMERFEGGGHSGSELNIGFTYARAGSDKVLDFIARVWERLVQFKVKGEYTYDQNTFNALLREQGSHQPSYRIMPLLLFPQQGCYGALRIPQRAGVEPVIVHSAFSYSGSLKRYLALEQGWWVAEPPSYYSGRFLAYSNRGSLSAEDEQKRLCHALHLAKLSDRTLIVPKLQCKHYRQRSGNAMDNWRALPHFPGLDDWCTLQFGFDIQNFDYNLGAENWRTSNFLSLAQRYYPTATSLDEIVTTRTMSKDFVKKLRDYYGSITVVDLQDSLLNVEIEPEYNHPAFYKEKCTPAFKVDETGGLLT